MKNLFKRGISAVAAAAMSVSMLAAMPAMTASAASLDDETVKFMQAMGAGWNLGNTFDAPGETSWVNIKTTEAMIKAVHDAGFESIRIPVSWKSHVNSTTFEIDEAWMSRVKEVVNWAYDDGMYVIINIHHDNLSKSTASQARGFYPDAAHKDASLKYLNSVWEQISEEFKDYDEHLVFETLNEPRLIGADNNLEWASTDWSSDSTFLASCSTINELNQEIVNTIRASGGNNTTRYIMAPGYAGSWANATSSAYTLPTDPVSSNNHRIVVSTHAYEPYNLCLDTSQQSFGDSDKKTLDNVFNRINNSFLSKGIPVVMGEMGITDQGNNSARTAWATYYYGLSKKYNVPCVLWDNYAHNGDNESHMHLNRKTCKWVDPDVINAIMDTMGVTERSVPADELAPSQQEQTLTVASSFKKTYGDADFSLNAKTTGDGGITYKTSNSSIASVSSAGVVTIKKAGTVTITVTAAETANYIGVSKNVTVTIDPKDASKLTVSTIADRTYTGKAISPKVTVKDGTKTLTATGNFSYTYKNNTEPGTATVILTFKGNYTGSVTRTFKIIGDSSANKPTALVSNLKVASTTANSATLTWTKAAGVTGYIVYRYDAANKIWVRVAKPAQSVSSYTVTGLSSATSYIFAVKTYNTVGGTEYGCDKYVSATGVTLPANVTGMKAAATGRTAINLTWNKVGGATGYVVYQYVPASKSWKRYAVVKTNSCMVTGLAAGTSYIFTARAYITSGGANYYSASFSNFKTTTLPAQVSFALTSPAKGSVKINWTKVTGAATYAVFYKATANGAWTRIGYVNSATTTLTKTGLTSGSTGYFTVRAYRILDGTYFGSPIATKSIKIK